MVAERPHTTSHHPARVRPFCDKYSPSHLTPAAESAVDALHDAAHLGEFARQQRTGGAGQVAYVVQTQVVQDQHLPVVTGQLGRQVTRHVIVHLGDADNGQSAKREMGRMEV